MLGFEAARAVVAKASRLTIIMVSDGGISYCHEEDHNPSYGQSSLAWSDCAADTRVRNSILMSDMSRY